MKKLSIKKRILASCLCLALLSLSAVPAQELKTDKVFNRGWYVGAQAGMPAAEADFSSFAADKFRPGWAAGVHGGYRFTAVWSLEMSANWGQQFLAEQDCCYERGYFLGTDLRRYHPALIPSGMEGWYYKDLKSRTFVQRYGLQVNMNILGLFNRTKDCRWRLELSPAVYAVGTCSDLMTKGDEASVADNISEWHLGYGGQAQLSYAVAENMTLGVYGGFTHLTGDPMDGMPELHSTNFIVDAGVKFSFAFGKKSKCRKGVAADVTAERAKVAVATETATASAQKVAPKEQNVVAAVVTDEEKKEEKPLSSEAQPAASIEFPVIYFSFNSVWVEPGERAKVKEIADIMKNNESIRVCVTGWGDKHGSNEVNKRVSLQRAEAVKQMLGKAHISAERVQTVGGGINRDATDDSKARNATIEIIKNK